MDLGDIFDDFYGTKILFTLDMKKRLPPDGNWSSLQA